MAQSLANVLLHLVFSTKRRQPWISIDIEEELFRYIGGTCRNLGCPVHKIGAADDHIHIACSLARTISISQLLSDLRRYIVGQREHHKRETFQEEFRRLVKKYNVDYDERYIWD